jgi:hypothetical protein
MEKEILQVCVTLAFLNHLATEYGMDVGVAVWSSQTS